VSLSARMYLVAAGIVLLGIAGQWQGDTLQYLWRLPAAGLLLALVLEGLHVRRQPLHLERAIEPTLPLGQRVVGRVQVQNPKRTALQLEIQAHYPAALTGAENTQRWTIPANQTVRRDFIVTPVRLGATTLGPLYVRLRGRLGLAWWPRKLPPKQTLQVVPHALTATEVGAGSVNVGEKQMAHQAGSGAELLFLRAYQPGDPPRAIDWKATARGGRPTVRVFSQEQHMELMLVLDAGRGSQLQAGALSHLHHYVNVAARLAELALRQGDRVGLIAFAEQPLTAVAAGRGMGCLQTIRAQLQVLQSRPRESNPLAAVLLLRQMLRQRGLVVFFTEIEDLEAAGQLLQATRLLTPKHIPLIASLVDEDIEAIRQQPARRWLDPYRSYAAQEYTDAVRRTVLALRRQGSTVELARPDRLDPAVLGRYRRLRERRLV